MRILNLIVAATISILFAETVLAYPTTARKGTTTVTGTYRPITLDLSLTSGTLQYSEDPLASVLFEASYGGTYTGEGYAASGDAGTWTLSLFAGAGEAGLILEEADGAFLASAFFAGQYFGFLTYEGGLVQQSGTLPEEDTPQPGDFFELYTSIEGNVFIITADDITTGENFELTFLQEIQHLGPYITVEFEGEGTGTELDIARTNQQCLPENSSPTPCGSVTITATAVPEPQTLALLGLGLIGLGWSRRRVR